MKHLSLASNPLEVPTSAPAAAPLGSLVEKETQVPVPPVAVPGTQRVSPLPPLEDGSQASRGPGEAVVDGSPSETRGAVHGRGILRRRPKAVPPPAEDVLSNKLRAAAEAVDNIELAIAELPVLTDLRELTEGLLGAVVELLEPQTAGIYLPSPDGFRVWASHGFANVERTMAVQAHQPLFADILVRHEAVLIEPLDLAHSLVAGVGGARTNGLLASPIEAKGSCIAVIVVGREHFENDDLDRLESLAQEAAMGLAVALGLDRLRAELL